MAKVVSDDPRVQILGPVSHDRLHESVLAGIQAFRASQYASTARYLGSSFQEDIEERLQLDGRSRHFYALHAGELVGTVRVTEAPFELAELDPELKRDARRFDEYLELSRLVVAPSRQGGGIGKRLLYAAMLWAVSRGKRGFVAICREHRRKEFSRFGLVPYDGRTYTISSRDQGSYRFMVANWRRITSGMALYYGKKRMLARLTGKRRNHARTTEIQNRSGLETHPR